MKTVLYILAVLLCGCAASEIKKSDYTFRDNGINKKVVLAVPKGYKEELASLDQGSVKALYYEYPDGAVFYFVYHPSWTTLNQSFIEAVKSARKTRSDAVFKGVNSSGLHWKEMKLEGMRFGYTAVPASQLSAFENAILSVRMK